MAFARKQTITPKVLDLNEIVENMLKMLRRLIGENIDLAWRPGRDLWRVKMDPSQIDQILANLCVNARDAIAREGEVAIETANVALDDAFCASHAGAIPGDYVRIHFRDTGCGMDPHALDHVFEPFFTTKNADKGTGLGLSTVYGIVKQNGGFIEVASEPEQGTTFRIYLPRYRGPDGQTRPDVPRIPRGSETILLVEDEPAMLDVIAQMIEGLGYTVKAAGTPAEAIRLVRTFADAIPLLVTDVVMPGMNGRALARALKEVSPRLKCLFMSGYTADVIAHQGVLEDNLFFLHKPFDTAALASKIREVLDA